MSLEKELKEFHNKDIYPFHMPGHKRQLENEINPYQIDITEIHGFDDLHDPEDLIKDELERIGRLYKADKSFILVNGSTSGNLAAIYAATNDGDKIIIQRNSHKSIYNGAILRRNRIEFIYPELDSKGIFKAVTFEEAKNTIDANPDAKAIILTSPTYEGFVAPIKEITDYAHERRITVIVDAAHGAHFGFSNEFPSSPVECGADITIMSLHKTMPAMTQTAVMHIKGNQVDKSKVQQALDIFETSSPSYVLMNSVSRCMNIVENEKKLFETYVDRLEFFYNEVKSLQKLKVIVADNKEKDISKIIIATDNTNVSGFELAEKLREKKLEMEMSSFNYVIAMTSPMDTEEGLARLAKASKEIDSNIESSQRKVPELNLVNEKQMESYDAIQRERMLVAVEDAEDQICSEAICIYPPGSPLVIPGEIISRACIEMIKTAKREGLHVTGVKEGKLFIVK